MAAELRGVNLEAQADKEPVEEAQTEESEQRDEEDANWVPLFFGTKAAHQRLVDSIHGRSEDDAD